MRSIWILALAATGLLAGACEDGVTAPEQVAYVEVEPASVELVVGESHTLVATAYGQGGRALQGRVIAWTSETPTVASIDAAGKVTALSAGDVTVRAISEGKAGTATIGVRAEETPPVPVATVEIGPAQAITIAAGDSLQLTARLLAENGSELEGREVVWASTGESVATVSASGMLHGVAAGTVVVTATSEGRTGEAEVTVEEEDTQPQPVVASVTVRPALVVTYVGLAADLTVTLKDEDGNVVEDGPVVWTSSSPAVASVDSTGRVLGLSAGQAVITATSDDASATVAVSFRTTSSYHLVYDREEPAFLWMDMRTGVASPTLTHAAGMRATDPSPSPTRSGLAYVLDNGAGGPPQIAIQNWSGTTYRFLAAGDQPAWSPDGDLIAFRGLADGRADIWVVHADGTTSPINLTAGLPAGFESGSPAWSPTGDRIVFAASDTLGRSHLWIMNANGTGLQQLTANLYSDTEPAWYGNTIVFTRRNATSSNLWRVDLGTGQPPTQLTHSGDAQMAAWSPDGAWIAFVQRTTADGLGDVMVMRPWGGEVRPLSLRSDGPDGGGLNPAWTIHF